MTSRTHPPANASVNIPTSRFSTVAQLLGLVFWIALPFAAAAVGMNFRPGAWYAALEKPSFNPPNWIFAPVWLTLYLMMGGAAWLSWRKTGLSAGRVSLGLFVAQLLVNGLWSWLFFGRQSPFAALVDIAILIPLVAATTWAFSKHSKPAALMLVPYIGWISFASVLNYWIWKLNP